MHIHPHTAIRAAFLHTEIHRAIHRAGQRTSRTGINTSHCQHSRLPPCSVTHKTHVLTNTHSANIRTHVKHVAAATCNNKPLHPISPQMLLILQEQQRPQALPTTIPQNLFLPLPLLLPSPLFTTLTINRRNKSCRISNIYSKNPCSLLHHHNFSLSFLLEEGKKILQIQVQRHQKLMFYMHYCCSCAI